MTHVLVVQAPKVKSPPVGRGRGTAGRRGAGAKTAGAGRGRARKRIVHHSEDNASEEEAKYIPRSSKRRAAVAAVSRMKQPSDYEDDDFDDILPARPAAPAVKPITKTGRPRGRPPRNAKPAPISDDDNDSDAGQNNMDDHGSSEESPAKKKHTSHKTKPTCQFGKECYRSASLLVH